MMTLYLFNISDLRPLSRYRYILTVNQVRIAEGVVEPHRRSAKAPALLRQIAKSVAKTRVVVESP